MNPASLAPRAPLKPLDQALAELLAHAQVLPGRDEVATFDADGRVLALPIVSGLQVPPNDNSSMDGYALRQADLTAENTWLPVLQRIAAGGSGQPLQDNSAARIFTGAPIPLGADTVVMQEDCEVAVAADGASRIRVNSALTVGQWIRRAGEDVMQGATVLAAGTRLTPAALGMAASVGAHRLVVASQPKVALFSTGDELVMPGDVAPEHMKPGAIYNSNRFFLRAMLQRLGCQVTDLGIVPDQREATIDALRNAARSHDLILTSGGVSVGEEDHIKPAVQSLGELNLWQIAIKPGKPFAYGQIGASHRAAGGTSTGHTTHFMGLPGNPVSSFVTFMLLVRPFLLRLQGVQNTAPEAMTARADFTWPRADKRREFLRVKRNDRGGLDLFPNQSSGVLTSAVWGDGLVDNPPGQTIQPGDTVQYLPFSGLLQ